MPSSELLLLLLQAAAAANDDEDDGADDGATAMDQWLARLAKAGKGYEWCSTQE